jgi:Tfp pilus assembly protein PilN
MIEINLTPGEKQKDFTKIAGINLGLINFKLLVPFIFLIYLVEPGVDAFYIDEITALETKTMSDKKKLRQLRTELRGYDAVKKQVKELNIQEKNLATKIKIVKEIVEKRQNPFKVLKYIADNTPKDVWIVELEIDDRDLKIIGYSKSWKSIGFFIDNLRNSIFFNGTANYIKPEAMEEEISKQRVETFEITTSIVSFK